MYQLAWNVYPTLNKKSIKRIILEIPIIQMVDNYFSKIIL